MITVAYRDESNVYHDPIAGAPFDRFVKIVGIHTDFIA